MLFFKRIQNSGHTRTLVGFSLDRGHARACRRRRGCAHSRTETASRRRARAAARRASRRVHRATVRL